MTRFILVATLAPLLATACGFECRVQGETEHFNDCAALQTRFDSLSRQTEAAARDDLDTCGELVSCEVKP